MPEKPMFLNVAYRNQMPIMQELLRLRDEEQLTEAQALWFRPQKPEEELFDSQKDPHEIHNLANDPTYADKLAELRQACGEWVASIDDTGLQNELELVNDRWPGQEQPATDDPVIRRDGTRVEISCTTKGASIGYKIVGPEDDPDQMAWALYTNPLDVPKGSELIAIAHRIGYKRSKPVTGD